MVGGAAGVGDGPLGVSAGAGDTNDKHAQRGTAHGPAVCRARLCLQWVQWSVTATMRNPRWELWTVSVGGHGGGNVRGRARKGDFKDAPPPAGGCSTRQPAHRGLGNGWTSSRPPAGATARAPTEVAAPSAPRRGLGTPAPVQDPPRGGGRRAAEIKATSPLCLLCGGLYRGKARRTCPGSSG